jgi:hypothetical protein
VRKLAIGPFSALSRFVSREFWTTFSLLTQFGWSGLDTYHLRRNEDPLEDLMQRCVGGWPEVVLFWESYPILVDNAEVFRRHGARIFVMTDDLHHGRHAMRDALRQADGVLATYAPRMDKHFPELDPSRVSWVPHAAGPDFLLPVNETPRPVVFVSGAMGEVYPLRMQMRELAHRRPELARLHVHPGYDCTYDYSSDERIGRRYAESMRDCRAAFTDALVHHYVVAKHFEIPATGALLIADRAVAPQLEKLGFVDGEHYVSTTAGELEATIERAVDPRNALEIDAIRRRGHTLVHERHTTLHRARQIDAVCTEN